MCRDKPQILLGSQASSQQPHFCFLSPVMPTKLPAVTTGVVWLAVAFSIILHLLAETAMRNESSIKEVTARPLKSKSQSYLQRLSLMIWSSIGEGDVERLRGEGGGEEGRDTDKERRQRDRSYTMLRMLQGQMSEPQDYEQVTCCRLEPNYLELFSVHLKTMYYSPLGAT